VTAHQDDGGAVPCGVVGKFRTALVRQDGIENDDVEAVPSESYPHFHAPRRAFDMETLAGENVAEQIANRLLVIDHKDVDW
jgi:hypothetical protein